MKPAPEEGSIPRRHLKSLLGQAAFGQLDVDCPGAAALVYADCSLATDHWGFADLESRAPITVETRFHAASLAKPFTALAVLLLEERGHLDIDDLLSRYLADLPVARAPITLRHLLTHTSGIRDQWPLMELAGWRGGDPMSTEDVLAVLALEDATQFPPGDRFMYSNSGFTLLAEIVEAISGQRFAEFVAQEIFAPLGMNDSLIATNPDQIIPERAFAYRMSEDERGFRDFSPRLYVAGPTSLFTTSRDMAKWLENAPITEPFAGLLEKMARPHELNSGLEIEVGLGCFLMGWQGKRYVFHTGSDRGFAAAFLLQREGRLGSVILTNHPRNDVRPAVKCLLEAAGLVEKLGELVHEPNKGISDEYEGTYVSDLGEIREIRSGKDQALTMFWVVEYPLAEKAPDRFATSGGEELLFQRNSSGRIEAVVLAAPTGTSSWQKLAALVTPPVDSDWSGTYLVSSTQTLLRLSQRDPETIELEIPKQPPIRFKAVGGDLFSSEEECIWLRYLPEDPKQLMLSMPRCLNVKLTLQEPLHQ